MSETIIASSECEIAKVDYEIAKVNVKFQESYLKVYHLFVELSIKLTWCWELHFLNDQPLGVIHRRKRRFKDRLVSS
jgi:hypothetical protein